MTELGETAASPRLRRHDWQQTADTGDQAARQSPTVSAEVLRSEILQFSYMSVPMVVAGTTLSVRLMMWWSRESSLFNPPELPRKQFRNSGTVRVPCSALRNSPKLADRTGAPLAPQKKLRKRRIQLSRARLQTKAARLRLSRRGDRSATDASSYVSGSQAAGAFYPSKNEYTKKAPCQGHLEDRYRGRAERCAIIDKRNLHMYYILIAKAH